MTSTTSPLGLLTAREARTLRSLVTPDALSAALSPDERPVAVAPGRFDGRVPQALVLTQRRLRQLPDGSSIDLDWIAGARRRGTMSGVVEVELYHRGGHVLSIQVGLAGVRATRSASAGVRRLVSALVDHPYDAPRAAAPPLDASLGDPDPLSAEATTACMDELGRLRDERRVAAAEFYLTRYALSATPLVAPRWQSTVDECAAHLVALARSRSARSVRDLVAAASEVTTRRHRGLGEEVVVWAAMAIAMTSDAGHTSAAGAVEVMGADLAWQHEPPEDAEVLAMRLIVAAEAALSSPAGAVEVAVALRPYLDASTRVRRDTVLWLVTLLARLLDQGVVAPSELEDLIHLPPGGLAAGLVAVGRRR